MDTRQGTGLYIGIFLSMMLLGAGFYVINRPEITGIQKILVILVFVFAIIMYFKPEGVGA